MSFDGLFTKAMVEELATKITSGRISKIHQPYNEELIFIVRANGQNYKLLLSAHPQHARVQLTNEQHDNPQQPPQFCMVLRKHLEGAIIESIHQVELDRIIVFEFRSRDELGDISYKQLIVEVMGRHSNIILIDKEREMIIDSIKHISYAINRHRAILPGQPYLSPPAQDKENPLTMTENDLLKSIDFNSGKLDRQLLNNCAGISPILASEIIYEAHLPNRTTLAAAFFNFIEKVNKKQYEPAITFTDKKEAFYFLPLKHLKGEVRLFNSLSEMLDRYYFNRAERERVKQQAQNLIRFINNEKQKNLNKIVKLKKTIKKAQNKDRYKLYGELLTAHIYMMKKGMSEVEVTNYYDENNSRVMIKLDPLKTPAENAQNYYSKYEKAKTALIVVEKQIKLAEIEVEYFDSLIQQIETASPTDIEEIREELIEGQYLRDRQKGRQNRRKKQLPRFEKYESSDGTIILVGKNNKQNEYLTMRMARQDEIWLHTKDIPGSHVLIKSTDPSEETIREAAILAAYFSKAQQSSSVPVDFTKVRHVKKPRGAKPGFVIYEQQQTVFVTPDEETVLKLRKN